MPPRSSAPLALALSVVAVTAGLAAPATAAVSPQPSARAAHAAVHGQSRLPLTTRTAGRIDAALRSAHGAVDVMLELDATPASVLSSAIHGTSTAAAARRLSAFSGQRHRVTTLQHAVAAHFAGSATRAQKLFAVSAVYDGIAVRTDASRLSALAKVPGVKALHRLTPKKLDNTVTVPLINALQAWGGAAVGSDGADTGSGVTIGVIDTGVDYTHKDFGGPGTPAAYRTAEATSDSQSAVTYFNSKISSGIDLAGDAYDPSAGFPGDPDTDINDSVPQQDPNPIDCNGHGTHVAGTAAGYGVTTGGSTYVGKYASALDESQFSVGPGVAPRAQIVPIKIFGCGENGTSSDLIVAALDWAAAPDGDPNHHLDVVNLSLGSDFSPPDDPDNVGVKHATDAGVTVVAASGNAGDLFNVGGAPGNAPSAIGVAASDDTQDIVDGLQVDSPSAAVWPAEQSDAFSWKSRPPVAGSLAEIASGVDGSTPSAANNSDGCDPLGSADAAAVAGKVAFLSWVEDDAARRCGSATRTDNVANAGAIGVVFANNADDLFTAGITGVAAIPAMLTTKAAGQALHSQIAGGPVTVTLTNARHNTVVLSHPATQDTVADFSSRGVSQAGLLKPDVAAPGVTVFSAAVGTGSQGISFSGTSMSTPHVAGEAALVLAAHPAWLAAAHSTDPLVNKANVPLEVKAAIMNTASTAVTCNSTTTSPTCSGLTESPNRVGAGRVDALAATQTQVVAFDSDADSAGGVSVSFGSVEAASAIVTKTRTVTVQNTSGSTIPAYGATYESSDDMPGATITVAPSSTDPIPAGGIQTFTVTLTVDPSALQDRPDRTLDATPAAAQGQVERSFVADQSGRLKFTASGQPTLIVPAHAAPRHVATMAAPASLSIGTDNFGSLPLTGNDVEDSSPSPTTTAPVFSTVDAMELQGVSGALPVCTGTAIPPGCTQGSSDRAADLKAVGVTSDVPVYDQSGADPYNGSGASDFKFPALGYIGIATQQPWRTPADLNEYDVLIDADRNGLPDAVLFNTRLPGTDIFVAELDALLQSRGGFVDGPVLDVNLLNGVDPSGTDTYLFNTNVMTLPFTVAALQPVGFDPAKSTRINYWVQGISGESGIVDTIGDPQRGQSPLSVDIAKPAVYASDVDSAPFPDACIGQDYCSSTLDTDSAGIDLHVVRTLSNVAADKPLGVLLLRHNNAAGSRAKLIPFATTTTATLAKSTAPYGYKDPITAKVTTSTGTVTGTVRVTEGATTVSVVPGTVSGGIAHVTVKPRPLGKHTLVVRYSGDAGHAASTRTLTLTVTKAATTTALTSSGSTTVTLTATTRVVSPGVSAIRGSVVFADNGVKFATLPTHGSAHVSRHLSHGHHVLTATYAGSATLLSSKGTRTLSA